MFEDQLTNTISKIQASEHNNQSRKSNQGRSEDYDQEPHYLKGQS